jgi:hypothetical protein
MKRSLLYSFFILISTVFLSCSGHKHEHREITPDLEEANTIHQSSLDLREEIMEMEKSLRDSGIDYTNLKDELKIWDKDIIEVPGFEHSHDDEHQRKYHVHNPSKPFSDAEHLEYQKVMLEEIAGIHERMKVLLAPKVMEDEG